jgi:hypothetical protein
MRRFALLLQAACLTLLSGGALVAETHLEALKRYELGDFAGASALFQVDCA